MLKLAWNRIDQRDERVANPFLSSELGYFRLGIHKVVAYLHPQTIIGPGTMHRCMHIVSPPHESLQLVISGRGFASPLNAMLLLVILLGGCMHEASHAPDIRRDHEAISRILDAAILSEQPTREFQNAVTKVRAFPSVDSAWTDGNTFFVMYKQGGIVSWSAHPEKKNR
jgi:hypothetical protein